MMPVAFVGYMGSGKSYWAKELAKHLKTNYLDLDEWLVGHALNCTINEFVLSNGELAFRKKEREALVEICKKDEKLVLATGGGTPCYYNNMALLNENFLTIYLDCSINKLTERLQKEKESRPLIAHLDNAAIKEFIAKHLFERRHFYTEAKIILKADELKLETLIDVIKKYEN